MRAEGGPRPGGRRHFGAAVLATAILAALALAGCGGSSSSTSASTSGAGASGEQQTVTVGIVSGSASTAPLWLAQDLGYFKKQGIDAKLVPFDAGADMIAPLGTGQIDVAAGGFSAGLYNAVLKGVNFKVVADRAREAPSGGHVVMLVSKDLDYHDISDLKGKTVALSSAGSVVYPVMAAALRKGGMTLDDITVKTMGFTDQLAAFKNGAIDAGLTLEPIATKAIQTGVAKRAFRFGTVVPNHQDSGLFYSVKFAGDTDLATRFMTAYIKGLRYYVDGLDSKSMVGKGPEAEKLLDVLVKNTAIHDKGFYRQIPLTAVDPDGKLNLASMKSDLAFWSQRGLFEQKIEPTELLGKVLDDSYRKAAEAKLPPYKPKQG